MKRLIRAAAGPGIFLALAMAWTPQARGATVPKNPSHLDLLVTFTAQLSVKVDGVQYSTRTLGLLGAGATVVPSSATVTNDSAGLTEKFQLHTLDASPSVVGSTWTVASTTGSTAGGVFCSIFQGDPSCPGADSYALQALFISSANTVGCPSNTANDWELFRSTVSATPTTYTSGYFADTGPIGTDGGGTGNPDQTAGASDGNMFSTSVGPASGRGKRGLCVRLTMPAASSTVGQHTIRLTVTAMVGS